MKLRSFSKIHMFLFAMITLVFLWQLTFLLTYTNKITGGELQKELKTVVNTLEGVERYSGYVSTVNVSNLKYINDYTLKCTSEYIESRLLSGMADRDISPGQLSFLSQKDTRSSIDFGVYDTSKGTFVSEDKYLGASSLTDNPDFRDRIAKSLRESEVQGFDVLKESRIFNVNVNRIGSGRYAIIGVTEQNRDVSISLQSDVNMVFKKGSGYDVYLYSRSKDLKATNREAGFSSDKNEVEKIYDLFDKSPGKTAVFDTHKNGKYDKQIGYGLSSGDNLLVVSKDFDNVMSADVKLHALVVAITFINMLLSLTFAYFLLNSRKGEQDNIYGMNVRDANIMLIVIIVIFLYSFNGMVSTEILKIRSSESLKRDIKSELVNFNFFESIYKGRISKYVKSNGMNADSSLIHILGSIKNDLSNMDLGDAGLKLQVMNGIPYTNAGCGIEVYAVKKNDLFSNANYRYILDKFKDNGEISFARYDVLSDKVYKPVKFVGFLYDRRLDAVIVAEKTLEPEYIDYDYVARNLFKATSVINKNTTGNMMVVEKSGRILYDNKNDTEGKMLAIYDTDHSMKSVESFKEFNNAFMDMSLGPPKYGQMLSYIIHDDAEDIYYIDYVDKDAYSQTVNEMKVNFIKWTTVMLELAIIALLAIGTSYALNLFE